MLGEPKAPRKVQPRGNLDVSVRAREPHRPQPTWRRRRSIERARDGLAPPRRCSPRQLSRPSGPLSAPHHHHQATLPVGPTLDEEVDISSAFALRAEELDSARARLGAAAEECADLRLCVETVSAEAR